MFRKRNDLTQQFDCRSTPPQNTKKTHKRGIKGRGEKKREEGQKKRAGLECPKKKKN